MLFFGVFLRQSAAKSRTNLGTKSGEATKRLCRLAPNLAHICTFILEWIYAKQIAPRDTRRALGGVRGSTIQKTQVAPQYPRGHLGGWGSQIQKSWEAVKWLHRLAPNLVHVGGFVWEWLNTIRPSISQGAFWGL